MFLRCLLLANMRALSRTRSISVDAPMMRYSITYQELSQNITLASNDSNSIQKKEQVS